MEKKENFSPGDLCCLYPTRPLDKRSYVIVIEEFIDNYSLLTLSKNLQEKRKKRYNVLFPTGGIDTVNSLSLFLIK
jgi:hypothetical protein